jgi:flagellar hook-length control protein FliK
MLTKELSQPPRGNPPPSPARAPTQEKTGSADASVAAAAAATEPTPDETGTETTATRATQDDAPASSQEKNPQEADSATADKPASPPIGIPTLPDAMIAMVMAPIPAQTGALDADTGLAAPTDRASGGLEDALTGRPRTAHAGKSAAVLTEAPDIKRPTLADPDDATAEASTAFKTVALKAAASSTNANPIATAMAAAFTGQPAALRQTDILSTGERMPEWLGQPLASGTPQSLLDTVAALDTTTSKLAPTVGSTAWSQALGDKVVWMAAGAQQTASLTLNPPNLGPLQVVLNVSNDQATASFFAAQPEVRQALEAALPKLREMMNEAGIQLGHTSVSAETPQQNPQSGRETQRAAQPFGEAEDRSGGVAVLLPSRQGRGLVDTFA